MRKPAIALYLLLSALSVQPLMAQGIALSARVGSLGPGLELTKSVTPRFNVRLSGHYFGYQRTDVLTDLEVRVQSDADVTLASGALFADFHPVRRGLRLTAGVVLNRNQATVLITPLEGYTINSKTFAPEKIGTMTAEVGHKSKINPYVGFGFGNAVRGSRLGLAFDLGVLYTDSPAVTMNGSGMIAPTGTVQGPRFQRAMESFKVYPLLSLGLSFKM